MGRAGPGTPLQVLKWLWQEDAPLLFRPRLDMRQWAWGIRFLRECLPAAYRRNIVQMVNLGLYSRKTLQALRRDSGIEYDQRTRGILQIYFDSRRFDAAIEAAALMRQYGCLRDPISSERAIELEPALGSLRGRLLGATYAEDDESGDARLFTQRLAEMAAARGVEFHYDTCVRALESDGNRITSVLACNGDGSQSRLTSDQFLVCLGSYTAPCWRRWAFTCPFTRPRATRRRSARPGSTARPTSALPMMR
jgi:D-amino-acid dehydrogenase